MKKLISIILVLNFLSSCTVLKTNPAKTMDMNDPGFIQKPVIVDLDVNEIKVNGTATAGLFAQGSSTESLRQAAVKDALKKANADVLIEPKFETESTGKHKVTTVTGFPATYKNFRSVTADDLPLIQMGVSKKAEAYVPPQDQKKKQGGVAVAIILGTVVFLMLVGAILG